MDESEFVAPELVAQIPPYSIYGARPGQLLDPEHVWIGRQTHLHRLRRHRFVEVYPMPRFDTRAGWLD